MSSKINEKVIAIKTEYFLIIFSISDFVNMIVRRFARTPTRKFTNKSYVHQQRYISKEKSPSICILAFIYLKTYAINPHFTHTSNDKYYPPFK